MSRLPPKIQSWMLTAPPTSTTTIFPEFDCPGRTSIPFMNRPLRLPSAAKLTALAVAWSIRIDTAVAPAPNRETLDLTFRAEVMR